MEKVFKLPLKRNDKIGTTPMVNEESCSSGAPNGQGRTSRNRPITGVVNDYKRSDSSTPRMPAATRFLTRSVRSTRAAAPAHGHQVHEEEEPERYSVVHGLGKPWAKPLDYSVDGGFLKRRKATIEWNDLEKLDEGQMLNDSIMTFYMLYLYNELKVSVDRVYFFNTHFFPTLTKKIKGQDGINYDGVKSWTKRDDVFSYDYIVVPINENLHWYLAIICNVDKIKRIQADEEVQEDSQDLDRGSTSLHTSDTPANPKNVADVAGPSSIVAETPAPDDAVVTKDDEGDDVNLFEESKELNLIDRNAEAFDELKQPVDERDEPGEQTLDHESGMAAASSTAAERTSLTLAPGKAMPASKKRTNHKPPSRDPDKPIIMILDSLGLAHSPATRALRQWLEAEGLDKRSMRVEIDNRGHYPKSTQIPMQDNYCDCGLYVLGYLRKFFINPDELSKKLLLSQMSAESDWPDMNPSKMRDDIRNLIFELNDARDGARKEAHKAKKTGSGKEFSAFPTKNDSKEVSPTLRLPDATKAPPASATPTPPAAIKSASTPTAGPPADPPRMGSPFKPESRPGNAVSLTTQAADRDDSAHRLSTIQDFPSVSAETPIQPRRSLAKRVKSPEVRVPVSSPHIDRLHEPYDGASDRSKQPTRQLADLESPLQNRDVRNKGNGNLRMSPAKEAQASSPSRPSRELLATSSPLQARRRSGSHDDPILVDDSQDLDVAVRKQTQSKRKPPRPAKEAPHEIIELDQSQESVKVQIRRLEPRMQNPPIHQRQAHQQVFNRDDSILEVDGLEWAEGRDISHALELSLQDPDEQIGRQANSWPKDLGSPMEDVFDAQAAYLQSPYTVQEVPETQETDPMEVDNDDRVVPESPAQRRSSPHSDVMLVN
ncbi:hypothetical protein N0V86_007758 [Didymella sp. IMI 355093]|nr:hypothetical protein N0V86_007758 [Didymella sp. IMI 355093]